VSGVGLNGDPPSAVGSSISGGGGSPNVDSSLNMRELTEHLDQIKASLDGREPDVDDLDDDGWKAVSRAGKIVELGSLGEGAGGAVTRCVLKGGKTVFALKVFFSTQYFFFFGDGDTNIISGRL
jgi:mitogen-activated protein kinase kinase